MNIFRILIGLLMIASTALAAERRVLVADYSTKRIGIVTADGKLEWEYKIDNLHDLHLLPNGNVLFQTSMTRLLEVEPKSNKIVWEYDAQRMNDDGKKVEVHAFQRLADGKTTMIVESGRARIIEKMREFVARGDVGHGAQDEPGRGVPASPRGLTPFSSAA